MSALPLESRMARLEGSYEQIDRRLGDLAVDINSRFGQVDARFGALEHKVDALQWRMTALVVGTWVTTICTILFHR